MKAHHVCLAAEPWRKVFMTRRFESWPRNPAIRLGDLVVFTEYCPPLRGYTGKYLLLTVRSLRPATAPGDTEVLELGDLRDPQPTPAEVVSWPHLLGNDPNEAERAGIRNAAAPDRPLVDAAPAGLGRDRGPAADIA